VGIHLGESDFLQITGETVGEMKAVADMHQRKAEMAKHSDAFIALPGWFHSIPPIFFLLIRKKSNIFSDFIYK
jgi:predicted Rossmann-fold nucleotide-binding protein